MSTQDEGNAAPPDVSGGINIFQLDAVALHALASGDLVAANVASPVPLTEYFAGPGWRGVWRRRSAQILTDPSSAGWITGVVWDGNRRLAVGRAGYHGPPDDVGMVEVGYAVDPAHRRQGYARAALILLLERAACESSVHVVRATIGPTNVASANLVLQHGFKEVGEQWDEEDGLEIIYETDAGTR